MKIATVLLFFFTAAIGYADEAGEVKNVDAEKAKALLADKEKNIVVLDVRTPEEYKEGHIRDAKLVNFRAEDFESKLGELDKSKSYLVHCRSGGRSSAALEAFKKLGFKSIYQLDGGMLAWQEAGGEVVK